MTTIRITRGRWDPNRPPEPTEIRIGRWLLAAHDADLAHYIIDTILSANPATGELTPDSFDDRAARGFLVRRHRVTGNRLRRYVPDNWAGVKAYAAAFIEAHRKYSA